MKQARHLEIRNVPRTGEITVLLDHPIIDCLDSPLGENGLGSRVGVLVIEQQEHSPALFEIGVDPFGFRRQQSRHSGASHDEQLAIGRHTVGPVQGKRLPVGIQLVFENAGQFRITFVAR